MRTKLFAIVQDITTMSVCAIVNAAKPSLLGGGGVDGAIHHAAGPRLLEECKLHTGGCPTGEAVITGGYNLPATYVIHTVGPVYHDVSQREADELLASCYRNSLEIAIRNKMPSIAFPAISTGIYGFPKDRAAQVAVSTVRKYLREMERYNTLSHVYFACFSAEDKAFYDKALEVQR